MLYGESKQRQMARSILPSTKRKGARINAALIKRRARRNTRQTLHVWADYEDVLDFEGYLYDHWDPRTGGCGWHGSIQEVMWDRRDGDKLQPMMRWAKAITAHLDEPEDRLNHMKRVLPDNLIGRHALGHLKFLEEFDVVYDHDRRFRRGVRYSDAREKGRSMDSIGWAAKTILSFGGHAEVNRRLREVHTMGHRKYNGDSYNCEGCDLRLLGGLHDVDGFAEALATARSLHAVDIDVVADFARELEYANR